MPNKLAYMFIKHYLCIVKLLNSNHNNKKMEVKRLQTASLSDALKQMTVGETCLSPDGYSHRTVIKTCCELKTEGYIFSTTTKTGEQFITRIK